MDWHVAHAIHHAIMPVFCPTAQAIFGNAEIPPAFSTPSLLCMGLFSHVCFRPWK
jgi:hypothetical protein